MERIMELVNILSDIEGMGYLPNSKEEKEFKEGVKLLLKEVQKLNNKEEVRMDNKTKLMELIEQYGDLMFDLRANISDKDSERYDKISDDVKETLKEINDLIDKF